MSTLILILVSLLTVLIFVIQWRATIALLGKVKARYMKNVIITYHTYRAFTQLPDEFEIEITPIVNIKLTKKYIATRRLRSDTKSYREFSIVLAWFIWYIDFVIEFRPSDNNL